MRPAWSGCLPPETCTGANPWWCGPLPRAGKRPGRWMPPSWDTATYHDTESPARGYPRAGLLLFLFTGVQLFHQGPRAVLGDLGDGGNGAWSVDGFSLTHGVVAPENGEVEIDIEEQIVLILG